MKNKKQSKIRSLLRSLIIISCVMNTGCTDDEAFPIMILLAPLFYPVMATTALHSAPKSFYDNGEMYIQPDMSKPGIKYTYRMSSYFELSKQSKMNLFYSGRIFIHIDHENKVSYGINLNSRSDVVFKGKIIPVGDDYIFFVKEISRGEYNSRRTIRYIENFVNSYIIIGDSGRLITLSEDVQDIYGVGGDLVIIKKNNAGFAAASLQDVIDSGGRIDQAFEIPEIYRNPAPAIYTKYDRQLDMCDIFATKDRVFFGDAKNFFVFDRSNGNLITKIELPEYLVMCFQSNNKLYWVGSKKLFGGSNGVYELDLTTLENKKIKTNTGNFLVRGWQTFFAVAEGKLILWRGANDYSRSKTVLEENVGG